MMAQFCPPKAYAVKHKDMKVRTASRSGGAFTALSDVVLNKGGVIYDCILRDNYSASHFRAETREQRDLMRGSKYIESNLGDTLCNVKNDIESGKCVLFTGTPCQVHGLRCYLGDLSEKMIMVDIVCHGVPSPHVWKSYVKWQENRFGRCNHVDFRNKQDFGWASHVESLYFDRRAREKQVDSRIFTNIFYKHVALRPSCYSCRYKRIDHPGDITIADFWAINEALPSFNDNKGVSLVMINTQRGMNLFEEANEFIEMQETDYNSSTRPTMFSPPKKPACRDQFWTDYLNNSFDFVVHKYAAESTVSKIKFFIKHKGKILN